MEHEKTMDTVSAKAESIQEEILQMLEELQEIIPELENLLDTVEKTGYRSKTDFGTSLSERIGIPKIKRYYQIQCEHCQKMEKLLTKLSDSRPFGNFLDEVKESISVTNVFAREYLSYLWKQVRLEKKMVGWASSENDKDIDPAIPIIVCAWREVLLVNDSYHPDDVVQEIGKRIQDMPEGAPERETLCQVFFDELDLIDLLIQKIPMCKMPIVH